MTLLVFPALIEREAQASGEIRIKTLEEIRLEKAAKSQGQGSGPAQGPAAAVAKAAKKAPSPVKRTAKPPAGVRVKTFSELLRERKRQQEEEAQQRKEAGEEQPASEEQPAAGPDVGKDQAPPQAPQPPPQPQPQPSEVRVKTLEEIRKEKAARMQAKEQEAKAEETTAPPPALTKRRILRINKATAAGRSFFAPCFTWNR